jgi:SAM-dependent methyltransferase
VDSPRRALQEASRVLRPGGLLLFLEHEKAQPGADAPARAARAKPPGRGKLPWLPASLQQRLFEGPWRIATGGCHLTRRTGDTIVSYARPDVTSAPFDRLELERFSLPENANCFPFIWLLAPHAAGAAVRRGAARAETGAGLEAAEARRQRAAEMTEPEGRPRAVEKRTDEARSFVEKRSEIEEVQEGEHGGISLGGIAKSAAEVAAVTGAVAVAAATVTAASTPALMRRIYHAAGRD